jgi:hypothetical protein
MKKSKATKEPSTDINKSNEEQIQEAILHELENINQKLMTSIKTLQQKDLETINNFNYDGALLRPTLE